MGVRTGTGTGRWLCRRRDAEERPELWPFLPVFPKLPLSLLVSRATLSHLLSRRSDKDKKQQPRARETNKGRNYKEISANSTLSPFRGNSSVNQLTKWLAFN